MNDRIIKLLQAVQHVPILCNGRTYSPPAISATNGSWSLLTTFGGGDRSQVWGAAIHNGELLFGVGGDVDGAAQIWRYSGGWQNVTPSWGDLMMRVPHIISHVDGYVYAGTQSSSGQVQMWRSANGISWDLYQNFGDTRSALHGMAVWNGHLYVGVHPKSGPGEVWSSCNNWVAPIWTAPALYTYSLHVHNEELYVGTGYPAEVFKFDGSVWSQVSNFNTPDLVIVETMTSYRGELVVAFGRNFWADVPPPCVLAYNGTDWQPIGTTQPGDWRASHNFNASVVVNDTLFVSMGSYYAGISLWALADGANWVKIGSRPNPFGPDITGDSLLAEWIYNLVWDGTDLYVAFASIPNAVQPAVWKYRP